MNICQKRDQLKGMLSEEDQLLKGKKALHHLMIPITLGLLKNLHRVTMINQFQEDPTYLPAVAAAVKMSLTA